MMFSSLTIPLRDIVLGQAAFVMAFVTWRLVP